MRRLWYAYERGTGDTFGFTSREGRADLLRRSASAIPVHKQYTDIERDAHGMITHKQVHTYAESRDEELKIV